MSTHVKVRVYRHTRCSLWFLSCRGCRFALYPTHAEALAAAWAHIKEHS